MENKNAVANENDSKILLKLLSVLNCNQNANGFARAFLKNFENRMF
jgi:hypothetical protein